VGSFIRFVVIQSCSLSFDFVPEGLWYVWCVFGCIQNIFRISLSNLDSPEKTGCQKQERLVYGLDFVSTYLLPNRTHVTSASNGNRTNLLMFGTTKCQCLSLDIVSCNAVFIIRTGGPRVALVTFLIPTPQH
jgi:hypothetical protein